MKNVVIIIAALLYLMPVFSQNKLQWAPLNPEFLNYIEAKKNGTLKTETAEGYPLGYIPSPLYLHFKERPAQSALKSTNTLPTKYDLRTLGLVTPAKDQGGGTYGGNCVAFATMGSIESRWLVLGEEEYDLSEQHIAACYGYEWGYGEGANDVMATAYLSRFSGPVLESDDPYNPSVHPCRSALEPVAWVPETRWLPKDNNLIKQAIMDFGGLYCSAHIDYSKFNETVKTYYYNGIEFGNHAWLVVGWDDIKLVPAAPQIGAWIIKNSWGDDWMDNGFVYCSYADTRIMDNVAFWPERWEKGAIDTIYMYDYLGAVTSSGYPGDDVAYGIAKYEAPEEQLITKIGTFINAEGAILDIEIYDDFDEKELTNLLNSKLNIYVEFPGYHIFDLPTMVNDDFYIKIRYYTPGWYFPIPVEQYLEIEDEVYANPVIDTAVNWISSDNKTWDSCDPDTSDDGENLTIRAYAVKLTSPIAMFESNKKKACLESNVIYTFLENDSVNEFHWNFGEAASPATADTEGPHQVSYSSEGSKTVSLIVAGPNGSDTLVRYNYITVVPEIEVIIPQDTISLPVNTSFTIIAFGADSYSWSPSKYLDKTEGQAVTTTPTIPDDTTTYYVTGYQGSCSAMDSIMIIPKIRPPNDNVCDAIEIAPGGWYGQYDNLEPYTNRNATVEPNEPAPPEGDCNKPLQWCREGGLQNSVWFTFIGTERGMVSFDTKGFDNQIAIYEADTCTDILNDQWTLIAANDDYYPIELFYAAAIDSVTVTPGQRYFVQFDGSHGGDEGTFSFIFWDYPLGIENQEQKTGNHTLYVYPNPGYGIYNFKINIPDYQNMIVQVFNLSGQLIYNKNYGFQDGMTESSIDISSLPAGIYQARVIFGSKVLHGKIILK